MIQIDDRIAIPESEIDFHAIRAQGPGGQNVNKLSTAIHLRFDVRSSSLPADVKERLLQSRDRRITSDGVIVIKAQSHRTQDQNRKDAIARFRAWVLEASRTPRKRIPTRPGRAAREKRLDEKKKRAQLKKLRSKDFE